MQHAACMLEAYAASALPTVAWHICGIRQAASENNHAVATFQTACSAPVRTIAPVRSSPWHARQQTSIQRDCALAERAQRQAQYDRHQQQAHSRRLRFNTSPHAGQQTSMQRPCGCALAVRVRGRPNTAGFKKRAHSRVGACLCR